MGKYDDFDLDLKVDENGNGSRAVSTKVCSTISSYITSKLSDVAVDSFLYPDKCDAYSKAGYSACTPCGSGVVGRAARC